VDICWPNPNPPIASCKRVFNAVKGIPPVSGVVLSGVVVVTVVSVASSGLVPPVLIFKDSITEPLLIALTVTSKDPSVLKLQLKFVTIP
jgi:hypothetical protein